MGQWGFLIGLFDKNHTALVVNQDPSHPAMATLGLDDGVTLMEVDSDTGVTIKALDDCPTREGFQVALLAGDARLFTWGMTGLK